MTEGLLLTQLVMLLLIAPMLLLLAALMIFHDPVTRPGLWRSLIAVVIVLAAVSLLDAFRLDYEATSSWIDFAVRCGKFVAVGSALYFATTERARQHERSLESCENALRAQREHDTSDHTTP